MAVQYELFDEDKLLEDSDLVMIQKLLETATEVLGIQNCQISLSLTAVTDEEIHQLNLEQRGVNRPTDVLSFPMYDDLDLEELAREPIELYIGDLVISTYRMRQQAKEFNHSYARELGFLTVHGFLHLLGFDHIEEDEEIEMSRVQDEVMDRYGLHR